MSKKNVKYSALKVALRERENTSRTVYRKAIQESSGMDRWHAWVEKRSFGEDTRSMLLAYGMMRGLPYLACEPKCADTNTPSPSGIAYYAKEFGVGVSIEQVKAWLSGVAAEALPEPPTAPPAPEAAPAPEPPKSGFVDGLLRLLKRTA